MKAPYIIGGTALLAAFALAAWYFYLESKKKPETKYHQPGRGLTENRTKPGEITVRETTAQLFVQ